MAGTIAAITQGLFFLYCLQRRKLVDMRVAEFKSRQHLKRLDKQQPGESAGQEGPPPQHQQSATLGHRLVSLLIAAGEPLKVGACAKSIPLSRCNGALKQKCREPARCTESGGLENVADSIN